MDWSVVDWPMVATHGLVVFISAFFANLFVVLIGDNRVVAALLAALLLRPVHRLDVLSDGATGTTRHPRLSVDESYLPGYRWSLEL
jgi:hypothetical protein